jgi:hypothetical protein
MCDFKPDPDNVQTPFWEQYPERYDRWLMALEERNVPKIYEENFTL